MTPSTKQGTFGDAVSRVARGIVRLCRENTRTVIGCICAVIFVWLLGEINQRETFKLDDYAYSFFVAYLRNDTVTPIMEGFSNLASPVVLLVMLLVVAAFAPGRRPGACAMTNLALVLVLNQVLKYIVERPRPDGFRLVAESGYSFPSGHSMVSMAFYGLLAWMVWHYERDRVMRWLWCIAFGLVIVMVGVSRIYLGVHYASDVLAGFCVSMAWLAFYTKVLCPMFLPHPGEPLDKLPASDED